MVVKKPSLVRRQKSTSFGSLQEHDAAAVATPPPTRQRVPRAYARTRSSRQVRGSQFEYASSLVPAELVRNRHHREVALRQVTTGRRGGRRRLVVDSCATRWWEKLVGAGQGIDAGRATLEWSRDYGRTRLEARERLRSSVYVGLGTLGCQTAGHQLSYSCRGCEQ